MERNNDHETVLQLVEFDIQRYCFCFRLVNNIIQKQIYVILTSGIPVNSAIILFNSFLHLRKILLYVFLIYIQYFVLRRAHDVFFNFFYHQYNSMIAFYQYPITKSGRKYVSH